MRTRYLTALLLGLGLLLAGPPSQAGIIGKSAEVSIGRETAGMIESHFDVDKDPVAVARVRGIGRRLAASAKNPDFPFEFHVIEAPEVNAFALPGGFIYVFKGLLQILPSDDALASVLAHEISHVTRRHAIRQFEKNVLIAAGLAAVFSATGAPTGVGDAAQVVQALVGIAFTRHDEADADEHGIDIMARAGYNPRAAAQAMEMLRLAVGDGGGIPALLRSHPAPASRVKKLTVMADEILTRRQTEREAAPPAPIAPPAAVRQLAGLEAAEVAPCEWFPLVPGARWSYAVKNREVETQSAVRVLDRLDAEPAGVYRVEYDLGKGIRATRLVAPAGDRYLSRSEKGSGAWVTEAVFPGADGAPLTDGPLRFVGMEEITVPAGEFEAAKVERLGEDGKVEATWWFARGVGLVKKSVVGTGTVQELLGYLVPKATAAVK